jgi:hypothetical protein
VTDTRMTRQLPLVVVWAVLALTGPALAVAMHSFTEPLPVNAVLLVAATVGAVVLGLAAVRRWTHPLVVLLGAQVLLVVVGATWLAGQVETFLRAVGGS